MKKSQGFSVLIMSAIMLCSLPQGPRVQAARPDRQNEEARRKVLPSELTHDYVLSNTAVVDLTAVGGDGELVEYRAFDGTAYMLRQYTGKFTAILIKPEDLELYTVRELLDQCDLLYSYFKELVQPEPPGPALTSMAFVKNCGLGCGRLGSKGIEIDPKILRPEEGYNGPFPVIVHEMAHNFDSYSSFIMVGPDPPHAWTSFWESYIGFYSNGAVDPQVAFEHFIDLALDPYQSDPSAMWETCVRDQSCQQHASSNSLQACFLLRAVQLFGPTLINRWLEEMRSSLPLTSSGLSPTEKIDLLADTLSQAAKANLACFFDFFRWPMSEALRHKLQRKYPDPPACVDGDHDGYSPLSGDCDDVNPTIHADATERINGVDEDCNRVIDDVLTAEQGDFPDTIASAVQLSLPCRVVGTISSTGDYDNFQVNFPTASTVLLSRRSIGDFAGWIYFYNDTSNPFGRIIGDAGRLPFTVPAGAWNIAVAVAAPPNFGHYPTALGEYELRLQTLSQSPEADLPIVPPAQTKHFNEYVLTAPPIPRAVSDRSGVTARFWVSGIGWVGSVAASANSETTFDWIAPGGSMPGTLSYRVQYYQDSLPITGATIAAPIETPADPVNGPVISSARFDGRKTITVSGVRFGTSPQVIINYADRSAFVKTTSDTDITLAGKAKKLGLKSGENTVQVYTFTGSQSNVVTVKL